ncbi:phage-like protein [Caballeronia pedi]|uniref:Phage-like protein n=1 Tax=Caballeronia pedi TaxID=1777141 RepID=A0A158B0N0_9BURK|nr:phage major capsid protein [Caballeronia pedi]SAK63539.1 phage-like protein [Caballeronia pedi]
MKFTIQEQIAAFEARRASANARMVEIMEAAAEVGATLDTAQQEEFDTLTDEIKAIDSHIGRLKTIEAQVIRAASPIIVTDPASASAVRGGVVVPQQQQRNPVITVQQNVAKGVAFTRYAIALMRAKGDLMQAAEIARGWHDSTPQVELVLRAAVAAGTTTDPAWAAPLVDYTNMTGEFIELLRPETIMGQIQGFRRVPFNIKMPSQLSGSSAQWVGEGKPKPVSALSFGTVTLGFSKAAGIVVMTDELVRFSNPSAEAIVQRDMIATIAQFLDVQFIDPTVAAVAGVHPASITNGAPNIPASGPTADDLRQDIGTLFAMFVQANMSIRGAYWIMDPVMALSIGMLSNALGQAEFPGINMNGGVFFGLPVVVSSNVPHHTSTGESDPATTMLVLVLPSEILLADDGGVTLDASREASLQLDDAPTAGAATLVSLWQNNMVALRAERFINWQRRRNQAVAYITGARYGGNFIIPKPPVTDGEEGTNGEPVRDAGLVTTTRS